MTGQTNITCECIVKSNILFIFINKLLLQFQFRCMYHICTEISVTQQKSIIIYEFGTKLKHLACERVSAVGLLLPVFANFLHRHVQYVL